MLALPEFACIPAREYAADLQSNWFPTENLSSVQCETASVFIKMSSSSIRLACVTVAGTCCIVFLHNLSVTVSDVFVFPI